MKSSWLKLCSLTLCISLLIFINSARGQANFDPLNAIPTELFPKISSHVNLGGYKYNDGFCVRPTVAFDVHQFHLAFIKLEIKDPTQSVESKYFEITEYSNGDRAITFASEQGLCHFYAPHDPDLSLRVMETLLSVESHNYDGMIEDGASANFDQFPPIYIPDSFHILELSSLSETKGLGFQLSQNTGIWLFMFH